VRKGIIVSLLAAGCLAGSAVAAANTADVKRGASSTYDWEIGFHDHQVIIFKVEGSICPATVLVHLKNDQDCDHNCDHDNDHDKDHNDAVRGGSHHHGVVTLTNCGDRQNVSIREGETVQCKVWPGHPLTAEACGDAEVKGTVQVIKI
jgi:hypothetical protein